jgi:flagellar biosynthesis/type III secretory pathway chaperone
MAKNRDLLKEAIADAKAVREMAIANAKTALEESFTPRIKEMFAAKLQEMELEEEELEEAGFEGMDDEDKSFDGMKGNIPEAEEEMYEEELNLDELLAELEEEEEPLNENEEESEEEESEEEGEPLDLEDMTDEDLKQMIEDVISDMISSGELEAGEETEEPAEEETEEEEMVDIEELLKEIEEEEINEEEEIEEIFRFGKGKKPKRNYETVIAQLLDDNKETVEAIAAESNPAEKKKLADPLLKKALGEFQKLRSEGIDSDVIGNMNEFKRELFGDSRSLLQKLAAGSKGTVSIAREGMEKELAEAYSTIEILRKDLNEVNLLNAKLLYTNKIFKSKNLNESQKVKVLSTFDKASTVGEVKLVFETLSEGLKTKNTIKENLGSASKSILPPTKTKQPIVEQNEAFARMQQLAFYKSEY